ncbi:MAG: c-type cytochrome [Bacteroidetes bacterium]|jgi:cytochrome c oxidase cbb3-type subunit 3|nr:c-type cytochrome [Bacteroidota bacterium]
MRNVLVGIRVLLYLVISFFIFEWIVPSEGSLAIVEYPIIWGVLGLILFFAIAFEIVVAAIRRVLVNALDTDAKAEYLKLEGVGDDSVGDWFRKISERLSGSKPLASEETLVLDHEYDGIRELDNDLPPWWKYLFYASIVFAVVYLARYHIFGGTNQYQELEKELAVAERQIAAYNESNKDLINVDNVELLTDAADLAMGETIYMNSCAVCHKDNGAGGIGPNLTDEYWILGGGIKNVYKTISEGGRPGKGMIPWNSELKPIEIAQVSSYVLSLQGTNPPDPKEPEGELWVEE